MISVNRFVEIQKQSEVVEQWIYRPVVMEARQSVQSHQNGEANKCPDLILISHPFCGRRVIIGQISLPTDSHSDSFHQLFSIGGPK